MVKDSPMMVPKERENNQTQVVLTIVVSRKFYILSNVLIEPFSVSTPVGDYVVSKRVYRSFNIALSIEVASVDLVELDMLDFDVILGMDLLHACFDSINCRTRVVKFQFPNDTILEWKGGIQSLEVESFHV